MNERSAVRLELAQARLALLEGLDDPASVARRAELEEECRELRLDVGAIELPYRADTDE